MAFAVRCELFTTGVHMALALDHIGLLSVAADDTIAGAGAGGAGGVQLCRIVCRYVERFAVTASAVAFHYLLRLRRSAVTEAPAVAASSLSYPESASFPPPSSSAAAASAAAASAAAFSEAVSDLLVTCGESTHGVLVGRLRAWDSAAPDDGGLRADFGAFPRTLMPQPNHYQVCCPTCTSNSNKGLSQPLISYNP